MQDYTGQQIGDYQVLRRIGRGAMADVYLAEQQSLGRKVALKILKSDLARDASYVSRFLHEARSAAALVHSNIVQVYEVGHEGDAHFIAQEYVSGKNLGDLVKQRGRLKPGQVLDILRQGAAALNKAFDGGIVHRDIKPENLMLTENGEVKVADFGLARLTSPTDQQLTQVGVTMGTPLYMSPEQIEGRPVDVRSDLYSLGVTAYHLLSGEPPFRGDTPLSVAVQHLNNRATPLTDVDPDVPVRLSRLVEKLMAKKPEQRCQTPAELLSELRDLARCAAAEGWADGPEHWSSMELSALRGGLPGTEDLDELMKKAARLGPPKAVWPRRMAAVAGMILVGAALGLALRPQPLLSDNAVVTVLRKDNVYSQLFHATQVESEGAWKAVGEYFPNEDTQYLIWADQGLVRFYLRNRRFSEARDVSLRLLALAGDTDAQLKRFASAALTVAYVGMEYWEEAYVAVGMFDFAYAEDPLANEPQLGRMFSDAVETLYGIEPGADAGASPSSALDPRHSPVALALAATAS